MNEIISMEYLNKKNFIFNKILLQKTNYTQNILQLFKHFLFYSVSNINMLFSKILYFFQFSTI